MNDMLVADTLTELTNRYVRAAMFDADERLHNDVGMGLSAILVAGHLAKLGAIPEFIRRVVEFIDTPPDFAGRDKAANEVLALCGKLGPVEIANVYTLVTAREDA